MEKAPAMSRSFGLAAPSLLEALKNGVQRLRADDLNADLARDCACKAWHLCDHVFAALDPHSRFPNPKTLKAHVCGVCPDLAYLRDICNETKHGKITRYAAKVKEARHHRGDFSSRDFSHDFDISRLEIELDGGQELLFLDVADRAVRFWSDFFRANGIPGASMDDGPTEQGSSSTSSSV